MYEQCKTAFRAIGDALAYMGGAVLASAFLSRLGQLDIVYSSGVLHHTGAMWAALEYVVTLSRPMGDSIIFHIQRPGRQQPSLEVGQADYNRSGSLGRWLLLIMLGAYYESIRMLAQLRNLRHTRRFSLRHTRTARGMRWTTDLVDWLGGWPFEVAK